MTALAGLTALAALLPTAAALVPAEPLPTPAAVLPAAVALLVVALAWPHRPRPSRVGPSSRVEPTRAGALPRGAVASSVAAVAVAAAAVVLGPVVPLLALAARWVWPRLRRRRTDARRRAEVADAVPEIADLLALCVAGGMTVPLALAAVTRWTSGPLGAALADTLRRIDLGAPTAEVLEGLPERVGEPVRPIVSVLVASERYGVPLGDGLDRVAREARLDRRRRAEERARRVPVLLLFPLVCCVLPAFGFLTVVPLLVGSLPSLPP